jgi:hypothetical protein
VIEQRDADHYQLKANILSSNRRAHGYYYTTHDTDRFYVAVPAQADRGAELRVYEVHDANPQHGWQTNSGTNYKQRLGAKRCD